MIKCQNGAKRAVYISNRVLYKFCKSLYSFSFGLRKCITNHSFRRLRPVQIEYKPKTEYFDYFKAYLTGNQPSSQLELVIHKFQMKTWLISCYHCHSGEYNIINTLSFHNIVEWNIYN